MRLYQVDAFADKPFSGNPAGVCILDREMPADWMLALAGEMNLSETAFLLKKDDGYGLRWFSPATEVELCGHATLASAHILWETGTLGEHEEARFHTLSGLLTVQKKGALMEMDFPAEPVQECEPPEGLLPALGVEPVFVGRNRMDYLVEVGTEESVIRLSPDFAALRAVQTRGVMVTSRADSGREFDFISRFFAPAYGIDEDPVTGSAHCALGPYWMTRLNKNAMSAYQASRRGGQLSVRVDGERVKLGGNAITVLDAELRA